MTKFKTDILCPKSKWHKGKYYTQLCNFHTPNREHIYSLTTKLFSMWKLEIIFPLAISYMKEIQSNLSPGEIFPLYPELVYTEQKQHTQTCVHVPGAIPVKFLYFYLR